MNLTYILYQGWPKCGPPKIFCGPCDKFWLHNLAIYYVRKIAKININYVILKEKHAKKNLRPAKQYLNEIWPVSKKVWPPLFYILDPRMAQKRRKLRFCTWRVLTLVFVTFCQSSCYICRSTNVLILSLFSA